MASTEAAPRKPAPRKVQRTQDERSAATREKLLQATIKCIYRTGFAKMTISAVSRRAGLSNGALQYHFQSKDDLLLAVIGRMFSVDELAPASDEFVELPLDRRVDLVVDALWKTYDAPDYIVIWDIILGTRLDTRMHRVASKERRLTAEATAGRFADFFPDVPLSREALMDVAEFVKSSLRGTGLLRSFQQRPSPDRQLRMVKAAAHHFLSQGAQTSRLVEA